MRFGNLHDVVFENNVFGHPVEGLPDKKRNDGQPEVQFDPRGGPWTNWLIRKNSFANGLAVAFDGPATAYRNFRVLENVGGDADCKEAQAAKWWRNVWERSGCGRRPAFAYSLRDGKLAVSPAGARSVRRAFLLAARGSTPGAIAGALRRSGFAGPGGGWTTANVRTVLADRMYLRGAYGPSGANPGLVTRRLWRAAQRAVSR
jgi:hypothetical protein